VRKYENWRELVKECGESGKPAKTWCMEHNIPYYTYRGCLVKADVPAPVMKKSLASASAVAYTMYQKFVNGMPLYRQEQEWRTYGLTLSRATLSAVVAVAAGMVPTLIISISTGTEVNLSPGNLFCHRSIILRLPYVTSDLRTL